MKIISLALLIFLIGTTSLSAQEFDKPDEQEALATFDLFFESMRSRDTVALKAAIHTPHSNRWFFETFSGSDLRLGGSSAATVGGFLKCVADPNGNMGSCTNEFENISIEAYHRYVTITAYYHCFAGNEKLHHEGIYTVQLLKGNFAGTDRWRIESVKRYVKIKVENEYFPLSEIEDGKFKCADLNLSMDMPANWSIMDVKDLFEYGSSGSFAYRSDSIYIKSNLLLGMKKDGKEETILVYASEPKFESESYPQLIELFRDALKTQDLSRIVPNIEKNYQSGRTTIGGREFVINSKEMIGKEGDILEFLWFDSIINQHLLTIEVRSIDKNSKEEILSILNTIYL